jgi:hypothetical protein
MSFAGDESLTCLFNRWSVSLKGGPPDGQASAASFAPIPRKT